MAPLLLTTLNMANRLEEVDIIHRSRGIEACAKIYPQYKSFTKSIGHGVAAVTSPIFGRKLNRVTGFGMGGPVSEQDLIALEEIYAGIGLKSYICMSPFAHPSAFQVLAARGHGVESFMHFYVRVLTDEDLKEPKLEGVEISRATAENSAHFPSWSVAGFKDKGRAEFILDAAARLAASREDTSIYVAKVDGNVAGTAAMAFIKTSDGSVDAHLYIDSTLPQYRGRGIHGALLRARLADARKRGIPFASAQADSLNQASCKNIERAGFSLAYNKGWFQKS